VTQRPELYAVVGRSVTRSRSPALHYEGFRALGIPARYVRLAVGSAEEGLRRTQALGVRGMNITAPYKEDFFRLCDTVSGTAKKAGAVNTVVIRNGRLIGHNTDVFGVAQALRAKGVDLKGKKAVVLGAGGAAKAAVHALISGGAKVTVANRTAQKARVIAESMGCGHSSVRSEELREAFRNADIVVSAVSTTKRIVPRSLLKKTMTILEANYTAETTLTRDALQKGCKVIDGREWLLFQGAKAFEIFTRRKAPLEVMRKAVYASTGRQSPNAAGLKIEGQARRKHIMRIHHENDRAIEP